MACIVNLYWTSALRVPMLLDFLIGGGIMMNNVERFKELAVLIGSVECGDFEFHLRTGEGGRPYLQIRCYDTCTRTGAEYKWGGRKWFLSYHMTDSEVVQTAWAAAKMAMEHELRETFKWEGETIFRPHFDIRALHEISRANRVDIRKEEDHDNYN